MTPVTDKMLILESISTFKDNYVKLPGSCIMPLHSARNSLLVDSTLLKKHPMGCVTLPESLHLDQSINRTTCMTSLVINKS